MDVVAGFEVEDNGEGEPVLLLHGSVIADAFAPLTREPALASRYRVIRCRRRGYGGSVGFDGPLSVADQANDAHVILEHLDAVPAHVVGHSFGGAVAISLALNAPELVHSLVVLEPAVFTADESASAEWIGPLTEIYRTSPGKAVHLFMKGGVGSDWRDQLEATIPGAAEGAERDAAAVFEGELPVLLDRLYGVNDANSIRQPVLYIAGLESGPDPQGAAVTHLLARSLERSVIPGVNHSLQMTVPDKIAAEIAAFLSRHPLQ